MGLAASGPSQLVEFVERNDTKAIRDWIQGPSFDSRVLNERLAPGERTLLHLATRLRFAPMMALLLRAGADPNVPDELGNTCAHDARDATCLSILLIHGVDLNRPNKYGATALHVACGEGDLAKAHVLVLGGAYLSPRDHRGWTPLDCALHWKFNTDTPNAGQRRTEDWLRSQGALSAHFERQTRRIDEEERARAKLLPSALPPAVNPETKDAGIIPEEVKEASGGGGGGGGGSGGGSASYVPFPTLPLPPPTAPGVPERAFPGDAAAGGGGSGGGGETGDIPVAPVLGTASPASTAGLRTLEAVKAAELLRELPPATMVAEDQRRFHEALLRVVQAPTPRDTAEAIAALERTVVTPPRILTPRARQNVIDVCMAKRAEQQMIWTHEVAHAFGHFLATFDANATAVVAL